METGFTIRPAVIADAPTMAQINIISWRNTYQGLIADSTLDAMTYDVYLAKWERIISLEKDVRHSAFVAEIGGAIIGYVTAGTSRNGQQDNEGELYALYLLQEHHGKGIGKALFLQAVEEFKKWGITSFRLYVLKENKLGRSFYDRFNPDEITDAKIEIDESSYCDMCYRWKSLKNILSPGNSE